MRPHPDTCATCIHWRRLNDQVSLCQSVLASQGFMNQSSWCVWHTPPVQSVDKTGATGEQR